jgi:hypothetical protein
VLELAAHVQRPSRLHIITFPVSQQAIDVELEESIGEYHEQFFDFASTGCNTVSKNSWKHGKRRRLKAVL